MWTGLVLAGGASTRMGADKATLVLSGRTLVARAVRTVIAAGGTPCVVGPPRDPAAVGGVRQVDETGGRGGPGGPLPALQCGLRIAAAPGGDPRRALVVALACDLPLVRARLLRRLVDLAPGHDAVVPRASGRLQVLAAAYAGSCGPAIAHALARGDRSLVRFLDDVRVRIVEEEEMADLGGPAQFLNVNAPADLARAEALLAGGGA